MHYASRITGHASPIRMLLATTNPAKQARLRELVAGLPIESLVPFEILVPSAGDQPPVDETGGSFRTNAERKAIAWARWSGLPALASDGGLDIPRLGPGWQALLTRRTTGAAAPDTPTTDDGRIERLLDLTRHLSGAERRVRWIEALALATGDTETRGRGDAAREPCPPVAASPCLRVRSWEATGAEAVLAERPCPARLRRAGFWVDRLRFYPALRRYHAELSESERRLVGDPWLELQAPLRQALLGLLSAR